MGGKLAIKILIKDGISIFEFGLNGSNKSASSLKNQVGKIIICTRTVYMLWESVMINNQEGDTKSTMEKMALS
jgi:hypothetical protein